MKFRYQFILCSGILIVAVNIVYLILTRDSEMAPQEMSLKVAVSSAPDYTPARKNLAPPSDNLTVDHLWNDLRLGKLNPDEIQSIYGDKALPLFQELLYRDVLATKWGSLCAFYLMGDNSNEAVNVVITFIERPEDWFSEKYEFQRSKLANGKASAIFGLGFANNPTGNAYLKQLLTKEGSHDLSTILAGESDLNHWQDLTEEIRFEELIIGRAARALMVTQDPENMRLVEILYDDTVKEFKTIIDSIPYTGNRLVLDEYRLRLSGLLFGLVDAMITNDVIQYIGMEEFKKNVFKPRKIMEILSPYTSLYFDPHEYYRAKAQLNE